MIKSDLYGALARGYCSEKNSSKQVDPDLIEAMADELLLLYCKTQGKLFEDPRCPYEQISHGIGLDHKVSEIKINCRINPDMSETYPVKAEKPMENNSSEYLTGHGRIICKNCGDIIAQCRCIDCDKLETFSLCRKCNPMFKGEY